MENVNIPRPTLAWKNKRNEESNFYSPQAITDSDKLLDIYLTNLKKSTDEIEIWESIAKVVKGFDELNIKHNNFIETTEREALAGFIQHAAEASGLKYDGDVTEEWRTEW